MAYNSLEFLFVFLPILLIAYQKTKQKYRWIVLLLANYIFFFSWSKALVLYQIAGVIMTYYFGRELTGIGKAPENMDKKVFHTKKHHVLVLGVLCNLALLVALKYGSSIIDNISLLFSGTDTIIKILVPIGISYYTLQNISYLVDISSKKIKACDNIFKLALYSSFFVTILEGPITRYGEIEADLTAGHDITPDHFVQGIERMTWGVFQKMVIADHLNVAVNVLFRSYTQYGSLCLLAAILCTIQLYMDFAGTIDIAIGTAKVFNITVAENFRQPFFAKNASDFWHRWHITLGTFLRDYVFYPISLSKPIQHMTQKLRKSHHRLLARYLGPSIALLAVWLANGFWHGPHWIYVMYGLYYFVFMIIEMLLEKPFEKWCNGHHLPVNGWIIRTFRFLKLSLIVVIGEMVFRALDLGTAWTMVANIFTNFHLADLVQYFPKLGISNNYWIILSVCFAIVIVKDVLKEKKVPLREKFECLPKYLRWGLYYGLIFAIIFFGAYGSGYDSLAMMYAGF
jgi:D-alanyl-lipoteichoic acid acyltransferase DltB (MBOAT superfamily)